jgi:hypothetical protein
VFDAYGVLWDAGCHDGTQTFGNVHQYRWGLGRGRVDQERAEQRLPRDVAPDTTKLATPRLLVIGDHDQTRRLATLGGSPDDVLGRCGVDDMHHAPNKAAAWELLRKQCDVQIRRGCHWMS